MSDILKDIPAHIEVSPGDTGEAIDLGLVDAMIAKLGTDESAAIPLLQAVQAEFRYLPRETLRHITAHTDITPSRIELRKRLGSMNRNAPSTALRLTNSRIS